MHKNAFSVTTFGYTYIHIKYAIPRWIKNKKISGEGIAPCLDPFREGTPFPRLCSLGAFAAPIDSAPFNTALVRSTPNNK